jgi:hypothetical protein
MEKQTKAGNFKPSLIPVSQSSRASTHALQDSSPDEQNPGKRNPHESDRSSSMVRRATGPRTPAGKEQSKHNATKHGILSKLVLLKTESRPAFDSLLNGLRTDLRPVGTLEEILVEKLAVLIWRYRRLIAAETGGIRKNTEFLEWDEDCRQIENKYQFVEGGDLNDIFNTFGLIRRVANPITLDRCVELLRELHDNIKTDGFSTDQDDEILCKVYGTHEHLEKTVKEEYAIWSATADCSEEERQQNEYASPEQCVANVLDAIEHEIKTLVSYNRARKQVDSEKTELDKLRASIPGPGDLDRLLRYEATINREFDRTLTQLERAQRIRLGQPFLPPIKVDLSSM